MITVAHIRALAVTLGFAAIWIVALFFLNPEGGLSSWFGGLLFSFAPIELQLALGAIALYAIMSLPLAFVAYLVLDTPHRLRWIMIMGLLISAFEALAWFDGRTISRMPTIELVLAFCAVIVPFVACLIGASIARQFLPAQTQ